MVALNGHDFVTPGCRVTAAAGTLIAGNSTYVAIVYTAQTYNNGGLHSLTTNTSRITIPDGWPGIYFFAGEVAAGAYALPPYQRFSVALRKNGTTILSETSVAQSGANFIVSSIVRLVVGDYVEMCGFNVTGVALGLTPTLSVVYLGGLP
jgi:hypothetical protein